MHFSLVDAVIDKPLPGADGIGDGGGGVGGGGVGGVGGRIVTIKQVSAAEEYLQDHFPGFPVLPGVMMIESMVQAARRLLELRTQAGASRSGQQRMVLGGVRGVKYGRFVKPGEVLRVEVSIAKEGAEDGGIEFKGEGRVMSPTGGGGQSPEQAPVAVSGRFTLRPVRL